MGDSTLLSLSLMQEMINRLYFQDRYILLLSRRNDQRHSLIELHTSKLPHDQPSSGLLIIHSTKLSTILRSGGLTMLIMIISEILFYFGDIVLFLSDINIYIVGKSFFHNSTIAHSPDFSYTSNHARHLSCHSYPRRRA